MLTITVLCLTEEWFILLWLDILCHYCLKLDRGVVHIVVAGYFASHYCSMFDRGVVHIIVAGYNIDHYYFLLYRGVVHIVLAGDSVDQYCL
jgi:hypothetical protein